MNSNNLDSKYLVTNYSGLPNIYFSKVLENIIKKSLPNGWFPYVTPGSKYVTIGGMVAADVHGKNHHKEGNFGKYINWIEIICEDGSIKKCSKVENSNSR